MSLGIILFESDHVKIKMHIANHRASSQRNITKKYSSEFNNAVKTQLIKDSRKWEEKEQRTIGQHSRTVVWLILMLNRNGPNMLKVGDYPIGFFKISPIHIL